MNRRRILFAAGSVVAGGAIDIGKADARGLLPIHGSRDMTAGKFHALRRFIALDKGRIAYVDVGTGPAALFLHGFPLNGFQWRGVIPKLSRFRRCIAQDWMGLGYTEVAEGQSVAPRAQAAMLAQLLDRLSIERVDIVANDSGGAIAQLFAVRNPQRVRSLLLTNCDTEPDSPPPSVLPVIELARKGRYADEWLAPWLADKTLARSKSGLGGACYMDPNHPTDEAIETYLAPLVASPQRKKLTNAYAISLDPNPLEGIESELRRCTMPLRIVWGTGDKIFSQGGADYLSHTLPNSRGVRRVPGAKLFFPEEVPDVIVEEARHLWSV